MKKKYKIKNRANEIEKKNKEKYDGMKKGRKKPENYLDNIHVNKIMYLLYCYKKRRRLF